MLSALISILVFIAVQAFCLRRLLRYVRVLQQDEYNPQRMLEWVRGNVAYDTRATAVLATVALSHLLLSHVVPATLLSLLGVCALYFVFRSEPDARTSGKVRLVITERARRIIRLAFVFSALLGTALTVLGYVVSSSVLLWALQILLIQALPWAAAFAVDVLQPGEERRQNRYLDEAAALYRAIDPTTIAITGSYGKTSVKNLVGELLQTTCGPTFLPRPGVNSLMGNTRAIRDGLHRGHQYAVIEMGAYRRGSIERVCELTPPRVAIITAIGEMHLERFGSRENIYRAKTELARALPKEGGILICNGDDAGARRAAKEFPAQKTLLYGLSTEHGEVDCLVTDYSVSEEGCSFTLEWQGQRFTGRTELLGRPALSNCIAAFTTVCALGADPAYALAALSNVKPVKNRLSIERTNGSVQLNDAYNSNPIGFAAALDVLESIPGQKKILMTPGMIELGEEQFDANKAAAARAASVCDYVVVVGSENRSALLAGLEEQAFDDQNIFVVDGRDEAFDCLATLKDEGNVVLIENDLPDLYEGEKPF